MGIGPHAIKLTRILHDASLLNPDFKVLELGSQDFAPTLPAAQAAIQREFGFRDVHGLSAPEDLYRRLGASRYDCVDLDGYHGAHVFDLNVDLGEKYGFKDRFDLVTNHGTTEHLFNQLVAFENIHKLTKVGGVMLHGLPFQGYQNHGMFNYTASLFLDLSIANGYEVFGLFLSIDDKLFAYDEDFLERNGITSAQDTLIMAVMIKREDKPFEPPYDGRYFAIHGKGEVKALTTHVGTTHRSSFSGSHYLIEGLDEFNAVSRVGSDHIYRFITPLWGSGYVDEYLNVTLPSQLSEGNLAGFKSGEAIYTIVTTPSDATVITSSQPFKDLQELMEVEFIYHSPRAGEHNYERMSRAYNLALERVSRSQVCFFLTGDDYYSNGLLGMAANVINEGKRVVMVPTIRVVSESFRAELETFGAHVLSPPDLVPILLRHEHPMISACVVNDENRYLHRLPAQTLYRLNEGYVGRWNVMHPLAVKLPARPRPISATVDWNYPALYVRHVSDIHVVRDSDQGIIASLSPYSYSQSEEITRNATRRRRIRNLKDWVNIDWALNFHVLQMDEPVYIHAGPIDGPQWKQALRGVDSVWKPFRNYIESRRVRRPSTARGFALDLLSRAVRPSALGELGRLARVARRRVVRKTAHRLYATIARRLS